MSWVYAFHSALIPACAVARLELNTPRLRRRVVIENSVELNSNSTRTALLCSFARLHSLLALCVYFFLPSRSVSNSTALYESSRVCLSYSPMRYGLRMYAIASAEWQQEGDGNGKHREEILWSRWSTTLRKSETATSQSAAAAFFSSSVNGASQQLSVVVKYTTEKG